MSELITREKMSDICGVSELAKYIGCPEKVAKVTSLAEGFPTQKSVWIRKEVEAWLAKEQD